MIELSERMFYKVKFNIEAVGSNDLLWTIVLHIKNRYSDKWNRNRTLLTTDVHDWTDFKYGSEIHSYDKKNTVFMKSECFNVPPKLCWACKIVERNPAQAGYAVQTWTTQIGLEQNENEPAVFTCILSYNDSADFIGPCLAPPDWTVPKIVKNIVTDPNLVCTAGTDIIRVEPVKVTKGDGQNLWNRIVNPNRVLPIVYLSPITIAAENGDIAAINAIDPRKLAETLYGNVIVIYSDDPYFGGEVRETFNCKYTCLGGQIRIYRPNVDIEDANDSYKHRFLNLDYIREKGEQEIISILRRVFAQDLNSREEKVYITIKYCDKLHREHARQQRLIKLKEKHQSDYSEMENSIWAEMEDLEQKLTESEEMCDSLDQENSELKNQNYALSVQAESFRNMAEQNAQLEDSVKARFKFSDTPNSVESVVSYFCAVFADRIAFSEDGLKTLKECTLLPGVLWNTLYCLSTVMYDLLNGDSTTPYDEFHRKTGIDCARSEGMQTRKDSALMRQFQTDFKGETINIEPHITFPRERQSIHFGKSERDGRIIIGSCGEHKEIFSSRKVK